MLKLYVCLLVIFILGREPDLFNKNLVKSDFILLLLDYWFDNDRFTVLLESLCVTWWYYLSIIILHFSMIYQPVQRIYRQINKLTNSCRLWKRSRVLQVGIYAQALVGVLLYHQLCYSKICQGPKDKVLLLIGQAALSLSHRSFHFVGLYKRLSTRDLHFHQTNIKMFQNLVEKPESEGERVKGDPARDLGTVHHICVSHLKELQAISKSQVDLYIVLSILGPI